MDHRHVSDLNSQTKNQQREHQPGQVREYVHGQRNEQQHEQLLEQLYELLLKKPEMAIRHLCDRLTVSDQTLQLLADELQLMGLDLQVKDGLIRRLNDVDKIDQQFIVTNVAESGIDKPLCYHFSTDSTNRLARESKEAAIFVADHQSAGRGRMNRKWITPVGQSIAMSISCDLNVGLDQLTGLNIVVGVAIIKTADQHGCEHLQLKWPNDVIGQQGKVAGILIEANGNHCTCRVIIGVGINWGVTDALLASVEQDCMNIGINDCHRSQFISDLIINIEQYLSMFLNSKLLYIAPQWHQYDAFVGQSINVIGNNTTESAQYIGINEHGMLKVMVDQQQKLLASGEVSIRKID